MKVHVLTAVTRPQHLGLLAASLAAAATTGVQVMWHWAFDLAHEHVGGQHVKNRMLDDVQDGWVWVLDDDTLAHPQIFHRLVGAVEDDPAVEAVIVSQHRRERPPLLAAPANVRVGWIDIGQAVMRRDLIGDHRIPEIYDGDGEFLTMVLAGARCAWEAEVMSYHNALT